MWPDDYIEWARRWKPLLTGQLDTRLRYLLRHSPSLHEATEELVQQAVREAFEIALDRRRYADYLENEGHFRVWTLTLALREMMRLLLRHPDVEPRLNELPAGHRRVLGMVYLDRLSHGDSGALLGCPPQDVGGREAAAREALLELLRRSEPDTDD